MITAHTETFCVIGNPVSHSLSPIMHNAAFKKAGYDGVYIAFEVSDIAAAVRGIRGLGITGASITIPHKISVIPLLDDMDETAREIGAVNTIVNRDGELTGYNTDCLGAIKALEQKTNLSMKQVLIIGAGGAARAIGFGAVKAGGNVTISNRSEGKGRDLCHDLGGSFVAPADINSRNWDIIINTTSVGMTPNVRQMPVPEEILTPDCVVMDIVYNPLETMLLKTASQRGCITIDGAAMFVHQGACQFELWTGGEAPIFTMDETVRSALKSSEKK